MFMICSLNTYKRCDISMTISVAHSSTSAEREVSESDMPQSEAEIEEHDDNMEEV